MLDTDNVLDRRSSNISKLNDFGAEFLCLNYLHFLCTWSLVQFLHEIKSYIAEGWKQYWCIITVKLVMVVWDIAPLPEIAIPAHFLS